MSMEEQQRHAKSLEADLQRTRQWLLNAEAIVQSTKRANEQMKSTVDYWSTYYEEENAEVPSVDPTAESSNVQLPKIPEATVLYQPQASTSTGSRPQDPTFNFQSQPVSSDMNIETSLAGWKGSNGDGSNQRSGATFHVQIKPQDPSAFHGRATDDVVTWLSKVEDFFYLTGANPQQQVAYTATLLLDAATD